MDGIPPIFIQTVITREIQSYLSIQNTENYLGGTQIKHGILQVHGKMIKSVVFFHLLTNKNFQSKKMKYNMLYFVILVLGLFLDMVIFEFIAIPTHQIAVIQDYQNTNYLKIQE